MSSLAIRQEVEFDASAARVWQQLTDVEQIVTCLPGASIASAEDERSYRGSIKLKVGPATMTYQGVAEFVELDAEGRRMRLEGKGREKAGGGQVTMTMESTIEELDSARSRVVVDVELKLAGKIVKFGRGMIGVVSERLFQDFADCLAGRLAVAEDGGMEGEPPPGEDALSPVRLVLRALWLRVRRLFGGGG